VSALELRAEPAGGAASRALLDEYVALVHERLGAMGVEPGPRFFVTEDVFERAGAAWLVAYEDGRPVGCGGLCSPEPGVGEIKRLFVAGAARGRGYGRLLLRELERRALAAGHRRMRLLTAEVLGEASALYEAEGYAVVERVAVPDGPVELEYGKRLLVDDEVGGRAEP
jgi:GNAT superfamily N-acetyltransferase